MVHINKFSIFFSFVSSRCKIFHQEGFQMAMYTDGMQTSGIKVKIVNFDNKSFSAIFSTIVKSFDLYCSCNSTFHIKIRLILIFHGPNKADNHKKSQLSAFCLSVLPNVCFIPTN